MNKVAIADDKTSRQEALLLAVQEQDCSTQSDLVRALKKKGISVAQASISRDIQELGLIKISGRYQPAPTLETANDPHMPLRTWVLSAQAAGPHLIVVKTQTSTAQQVGLALDKLARPGLVGTIAGDDTVFVAFAEHRACSDFLKFLTSTIA